MKNDLTQFEVYYDGKPTGIIVNKKAVKMSDLIKVVPSAVPLGEIEFKKKLAG